jgi:hypothetical protein
VWLHRGTLTLRGTNGALGDNSFLLADGSLIAGYNAPRLSPNGVGTWADSHLRVDQTGPAEVRIGFHEAGSSALTLYKAQGSNNQLRVRGNDGTDAAIAMAPVHALVGSWDGVSGWAVPQANVWTETEVQVNVNAPAGARLRVEYTACVESGAGAAAGTVIYLAIGYDGTLPWTARTVVTTQAPSWAYPMCCVFYIPTAYWPGGTHRLSLFMYAGVAGSHLTGSVGTTLYVTELRA